MSPFLVATRVQGRVDLLVGVDPVEKMVPVMPSITRIANIANVITINGSARSLSWDNAIEAAGRLGAAGIEVGPRGVNLRYGVPSIYRQPVSNSNIVLNMGADHGSFGSMFQARLPTGLSAEEMAASIIRSTPR